MYAVRLFVGWQDCGAPPYPLIAGLELARLMCFQAFSPGIRPLRVAVLRLAAVISARKRALLLCFVVLQSLRAELWLASFAPNLYKRAGYLSAEAASLFCPCTWGYSSDYLPPTTTQSIRVYGPHPLVQVRGGKKRHTRQAERSGLYALSRLPDVSQLVHRLVAGGRS